MKTIQFLSTDAELTLSLFAPLDSVFSLDLLTAREHLTMYGRIRGIPEAELTPLVQHLIDKLGLKPFADNITKSYSGGNMRKCSLALALIGNPSVVFLSVTTS